jgi:hypothetical protein
VLPGVNNQSVLGQDINLNFGLAGVVDWLMRADNYFVVRLNTSVEPYSGRVQVKVLYYPLAAPLVRVKLFPTYLRFRSLLNHLSFRVNIPSRVLAFRLWQLKRFEFNQRFTKAKVKRQLNQWLTTSMFRGACSPLHQTRVVRASVSSKIYRRFAHYSMRPNRLIRWCSDTPLFLSGQLEQGLLRRTGKHIRVKAINVFNYLIAKHRLLDFKTHQNHLWGPYHRNKKFFQAYYDIVNAFYVLCYIPKSEKFTISILQHSLIKMHRRKLKPKRLFYFIDNLLKEMPDVRENFDAFRVIITGKLAGGTGRTSTFSAGYGVLPLQSLSTDICSEFGDIRSKYGSFGIKIFTQRK